MILGKQDICDAIDSGKWKAYRDGKRVYSGGLTVNTNSINISLSDHVLIPVLKSKDSLIDLHDPNSIAWSQSNFFHLKIYPGDFFLVSVRERIDCTAPLFIHGQDRYFAPMIEGRSTVARCGLSLHETAGFSEHGFKSNFTLEISSKLPIILRPKDEIGQIYFDEVSCGGAEYDSVYKDQNDFPKAPIIGKDRFRRHD